MIFFIIPKTRTEFWTDKITGTIQRDKINNDKLKDLGWNVITVWECDLKNDKFQQTVEDIISGLKQNSNL